MHSECFAKSEGGLFHQDAKQVRGRQRNGNINKPEHTHRNPLVKQIQECEQDSSVHEVHTVRDAS